MAVSKRFLQLVAVLFMVLSFAFFFLSSFWPVIVENKENVSRILGVLENLLVMIMGFFFGAAVKHTE